MVSRGGGAAAWCGGPALGESLPETEMAHAQPATKTLLVRTRLFAAQQRLAFAGLLHDRLAERGLVPGPDTDVCERVAEALPPPAVECLFSALGDLEGEFDRCGALYHIATQGSSASRSGRGRTQQANGQRITRGSVRLTRRRLWGASQWRGPRWDTDSPGHLLT